MQGPEGVYQVTLPSLCVTLPCLLQLLCSSFSAPACLSATFPCVLGYLVTFPWVSLRLLEPQTHLYTHHAPRFLSTSVSVLDYASVSY